MKKLLLIPGFIALSLLLVGCDDDTPAQVQNTDTTPPAQVVQGQPVAQQPQIVYVQPEQQPQNPEVVYQQAPQQSQPVVVQQHDSAGNLLTGMMLGHMLSNSGSSNRTVVNKTIINKNYVKPSRSYYGSRSYSSGRSFGSNSRRSFSRRR